MAFKNVHLILFMTCLIAYAAAAATRSYGVNDMKKPGYDLQARLQASGNQATECLKAIQESKKSCSNVTIQFFLSGEADIASCCSTIDAVTSKCSWANTLLFFGYTPLESNILKAYCNAVVPAPSPAST